MKFVAILALAALVLAGGGCAFLKSVDAKIPNMEVCLFINGKQVCVKKNGTWSFSANLTPEEKAQAEEAIKELE